MLVLPVARSSGRPSCFSRGRGYVFASSAFARAPVRRTIGGLRRHGALDRFTFVAVTRCSAGGERRQACSNRQVEEHLASTLTAEVLCCISDLQMPSDHAAEQAEVVRVLESASNAAMDGVSVMVFGSATTGTCLPTSDLDVCLVIPGCASRKAHTRALRNIGSKLRQSSGAKRRVEPIFGAEVPILRWVPRRPGLRTCDISVNNGLAVANSALLSQYARLDVRVQALMLAVKAWARGRGINNRSQGTLSSFALIMMLVHFLQRRRVLPSLQDIAISKKQLPVFCQGTDCRFATRLEDIEEGLKSVRGAHGPNDDSVGVLLHGFFQFFGYEYDIGSIAIRDTRKFLPSERQEDTYLFVDNPFEPGKDVANVEPRFYTRIREEFRRAHVLLDGGEGFSKVCETAPAFGEDPLRGPLVPGVNTPMVRFEKREAPP